MTKSEAAAAFYTKSLETTWTAQWRNSKGHGMVKMKKYKAIKITPFLVWWQGTTWRWGIRRDEYRYVLDLGALTVYPRGF